MEKRLRQPQTGDTQTVAFSLPAGLVDTLTRYALTHGLTRSHALKLILDDWERRQPVFDDRRVS